MFQHRDYHLALEKLQTAPLTLSERDFDVLHAFNPADEVRGRAAVRQAQLALVPLPLRTTELTAAEVYGKALDRPPAQPPSVFDPRLARVIGKAISESVVVPIGERLGALTRRIEELEELTKTQAATLLDLSSENKALGQFIADTQRPPSLDASTHGTKH